MATGREDPRQRLERLADAARTQLAHLPVEEAQSRAAALWRELTEAWQFVRGRLDQGGWRTPPADLQRRVDHLLAHMNLNDYGVDPFGFSPAYVGDVVPFIEAMYRLWFRAEVFDIDRVPAQGRVLIIANHSGQLPFDGAVIGASLLLERDPPRMIRSMIEKFAASLPFFGTFCARCGQITGLPDNCRRLLEAEESVLVFPEGAAGISKPFQRRYQLARFGHGFMRLALQTRTPIVPVGVVGAEEQIINVGNFERLARMVGAPSLPIPPLALLLGPLAMVPMPVKYRVYYGEPLHFDGDPHDDDAVIAAKVGVVKRAIEELVARGLRERRGIFV